MIFFLRRIAQKNLLIRSEHVENSKKNTKFFTDLYFLQDIVKINFENKYKVTDVDKTLVIIIPEFRQLNTEM